MPIFKTGPDTPKAFKKKYPVTGSTINLNTDAIRDKLKWSLMVPKVNAPPMESIARGKVTAEDNFNLLLINYRIRTKTGKRLFKTIGFYNRSQGISASLFSISSLIHFLYTSNEYSAPQDLQLKWTDCHVLLICSCDLHCRHRKKSPLISMIPEFIFVDRTATEKDRILSNKSKNYGF